MSEVYRYNKEQKPQKQPGQQKGLQQFLGAGTSEGGGENIFKPNLPENITDGQETQPTAEEESTQTTKQPEKQPPPTIESTAEENQLTTTEPTDQIAEEQPGEPEKQQTKPTDKKTQPTAEEEQPEPEEEKPKETTPPESEEEQQTTKEGQSTQETQPTAEEAQQLEEQQINLEPEEQPEEQEQIQPTQEQPIQIPQPIPEQLEEQQTQLTAQETQQPEEQPTLEEQQQPTEEEEEPTLEEEPEENIIKPLNQAQVEDFQGILSLIRKRLERNKQNPEEPILTILDKIKPHWIIEEQLRLIKLNSLILPPEIMKLYKEELLKLLTGEELEEESKVKPTTEEEPTTEEKLIHPLGEVTLEKVTLEDFLAAFLRFDSLYEEGLNERRLEELLSKDVKNLINSFKNEFDEQSKKEGGISYFPAYLIDANDQLLERLKHLLTHHSLMGTFYRLCSLKPKGYRRYYNHSREFFRWLLEGYFSEGEEFIIESLESPDPQLELLDGSEYLRTINQIYLDFLKKWSSEEQIPTQPEQPEEQPTEEEEEPTLEEQQQPTKEEESRETDNNQITGILDKNTIFSQFLKEGFDEKTGESLGDVIKFIGEGKSKIDLEEIVEDISLSDFSGFLEKFNKFLHSLKISEEIRKPIYGIFEREEEIKGSLPVEIEDFARIDYFEEAIEAYREFLKEHPDAFRQSSAERGEELDPLEEKLWTDFCKKATALLSQLELTLIKEREEKNFGKIRDEGLKKLTSDIAEGIIRYHVISAILRYFITADINYWDEYIEYLIRSSSILGEEQILPYESWLKLYPQIPLLGDKEKIRRGKPYLN